MTRHSQWIQFSCTTQGATESIGVGIISLGIENVLA